MADQEIPIKIAGIERGVGDRAFKFTRVDFRVYRDAPAPPLELPMLVPTGVDDGALVAVARNYLAKTLERLAAQTASWKLTEEQFRELVPKQPDR